jgi:heterotetrameric sarcosine oxidase gamma subunit
VKLYAKSALETPSGSACLLTGLVENGAALRVRPDIGCLLLNAAVETADIVVRAGAAAGLQLPPMPGTIKTSAGRMSLWLSPRSWLVLCRSEDESWLVRRVNAAYPDKLLHAAHFTDHLFWFELSGARSGDLLKEGAFISLERQGLIVGNAKRTLIAGIAAVVIRKEDSVWLVGIERSRARYFADWLIATAQKLTE